MSILREYDPLFLIMLMHVAIMTSPSLEEGSWHCAPSWSVSDDFSWHVNSSTSLRYAWHVRGVTSSNVTVTLAAAFQWHLVTNMLSIAAVKHHDCCSHVACVFIVEFSNKQMNDQNDSLLPSSLKRSDTYAEVFLVCCCVWRRPVELDRLQIGTNRRNYRSNYFLLKTEWQQSVLQVMWYTT